MKFCPECGFELKPGDEFCINCGASLIDYKDAYKDAPEESSGKPKKSFFKTPGGIILIVIAALLVAAGVACLVYFNSPKIKLLRAAKNTADDVSSMEKVKIIDRVINGGSIEAEASLQNIIEGFSIPLIGQIDATATVKYYMDAENDSCELSVSGGLGGSQAIGADIWADPHRVIVKSPALIGKTAYGFETSDEESRKELEKLVSEYLDVDIEEADRYIEIADTYSKNKDELNKQLALKLYEEAFKNGDVEKGKEEITIAGEDIKTESIYLALSGEQLRKMLNGTYDDLKDKEEFSEVVSLIEEDELKDKIDEIPDDYKLDFKFYINNKTRLVRVESRADKVNVTAFIGPDPAEAKEFSITVDDDSDKKGLAYRVDTDNESKYLSHVSCQLPRIIEEKLGLLNLSVNPDELTGDISWDKAGGNWELATNFGLSSDGDFNYDGSKADGVIENIALESQKLSPKIRFKIREEDKMPKAPEYRAVVSEEDSDALVTDITDSIKNIGEELLGSAANLVINQVFGIDLSPEEPEVIEPEQLKPESQLPDTKQEGEKSEETLKIAGFEIKASDISAVQSILKLFGVDVDLSGMDIPAVQRLIDSLGIDEIDPAVIQGAASILGIDPSIIQFALPQTQNEEKKENKTYSEKNDTIEMDESVQKEETFANDVCELKLKADGTYSLKFTDGQMNYEDSGTFTRKSDDTMLFKSSLGIDAAGKYFSDHIEVTIPGFGSFSIPKK